MTLDDSAMGIAVDECTRTCEVQERNEHPSVVLGDLAARRRPHGHVIAFAEDPNYRAFTEASMLLFMNAVLLGPGY